MGREHRLPPRVRARLGSLSSMAAPTPLRRAFSPTSVSVGYVHAPCLYQGRRRCDGVSGHDPAICGVCEAQITS